MAVKMKLIRGRCINTRCSLPLDLKVYTEDRGRKTRAKVVCEACGCSGPTATHEDAEIAEAEAVSSWDGLPRWEPGVHRRAWEAAGTIRAVVADSGGLGIVELKATDCDARRMATPDALAAILVAAGFGEPKA